MKHVTTGALIALAAGGLFVAGCEKKAPETKSETTPETKAAPAAPDDPAEKTSKVDCAGVNACKGQGTCHTDKHACAGQNACKGQGVLAMTEAECTAKGGTVAARK